VRRIGITTTVPSEVIWSAGCAPVDLNNLFIASTDRDRYIKLAEREGYPRNVCGWIKGIYGALASDGGIDTIVAVTQGDCSNTHALMETLRLRGIRTIPFAYPYNRDPETLRREIARLADTLGSSIANAERCASELEPLRRKLDTLDELTWKDDRVTGGENHLFLVSSSDFNGNIASFERDLDILLATARNRPPDRGRVRLGFIGVPPIIDDLYDAVESMGARVVFNEVQRQFSMPVRGAGLVDQYLAYTYPYDIFHRIDAILPEIGRRRIHGIIHYVQSFCHRQISDLVIRKTLPVPVLTIEGDQPGRTDERTRMRLQAFVELLESRAGEGACP
jgi:benzoyl-CoA reductase/2-hydroxyglutaryl-CoA dehydratase subunit BcrC/BadD/HgdB